MIPQSAWIRLLLQTNLVQNIGGEFTDLPYNFRKLAT